VLQFFFDVQWHRLKETANSLGISIVGDIPIFVAPDSVDSWSHIELFKTDEAGRYSFVSGVPPDYFSVTGQLWGNPVYDWKVMQENGYEWWLQRLKRLQELTDIIRIDHFRGFQAYWSVPYGNPTAEIGTWEKAPGMDFFCKVKERFPAIRIFAEDLGVITPDVEALRDSNGFPGMRIAQFGFTFDAGGKLHPYDTFLPHNYGERCVAYTGTHDNQTVKGWFEDLKEKEKKQVCSYLGCTKQDVCAGMVKAVMQSHARYAIFPLQDILGLGDEARMNTPATCGGHNWAWQLMPEADLTPVLSDLREKIFLYGRM
jgi:4-alpha-glucanotransferase